MGLPFIPPTVIDYVTANSNLGSTYNLQSWLGFLDEIVDTTDRPTYKKYGAKADALKLLDGVIAGGSLSVLTSASASFKPADVGKVISIANAGAANGHTSYNAPLAGNNSLTTTISAVNSLTSVTLTVASTVAVSGAAVVYGTDDTAAIQKALDSAATRGYCAVDLGGRNYLVSDTLSFSYGRQTLRNGHLYAIDTGPTTYNGSASTYNYTQICVVSLNSHYGQAYTGPAYPNGKTFAGTNWTGTDADWLYDLEVSGLVIDQTLVSWNFPGITGGRIVGDGSIGGSYIGRVRVYNNTIINGLTSTISAHACYDTTIYNNTVENLRCTMALTDPSGAVFGGNCIQIFTAYPGTADAYLAETGASKVLTNTVIGSPSNTSFPGVFSPSTANCLFSANIGIDIQTGARPNGVPAFRVQGGTYAVNDRISNNGGYVYVATAITTGIASGSAPSATSGNTPFVDGGVTWVLALSGKQWVPSFPNITKSYALNDRCNNNGITYICTTAGNSASAAVGGGALPSGPTGTGTGIADGTCVWASTYGGPGWTQNTPYNVGQKLFNGIYYFQCVVAGTSAATGVGPSGKDGLVSDGGVVWQAIKSYMRPIPQIIVMGNIVRRCFYGVAVEGQRSGGSGDVIVNSNYPSDCMIGLDFFADQVDFNGMEPFDGGYNTLLTDNTIERPILYGVAIQGEDFILANNKIVDWGVCSLNLRNLGYNKSSQVSQAMLIQPSLGSTTNITSNGGMIHDNTIVSKNNYDPVMNFFTMAGIFVTTNFPNQIWKNVSIKNNILDFGTSFRIRATTTWAASTAYSTVGMYVWNGTNIYRLVTAGTSAASGGPTGTGTANITDNSCVWQFAQVAATLGSSAITIWGLLQDIEVHNNKVIKAPYSSLAIAPFNGTATQQTAPSRLSVKDNTFIDNGTQTNGAGSSTVMTIAANGVSDYSIEDNTSIDTVNKVGVGISWGQEVTGTDPTITGLRIVNNKMKSLFTSFDVKAFQLAVSGTNIRIERNDQYNYVSAIPVLSGLGPNFNVYAGTFFQNTVPTQGNPYGWVVNVTGKATTTAWAIGAIAANSYVTNVGNVYFSSAGGTSAAPGPTHTSGTVSDGGGVSWKYISPQPTFSPVGLLEPTPSTSLSAAGTTLATATQMAKGVSTFTTVASGTGGNLPVAPVANDSAYVLNAGANALLIYPGASGNTINALSAGTGFSIAAGATGIFKAISPTSWLAN